MASGLTFFLTGDVMTGRGIDQILPESVDPVLYESYVKDARHYLQLAERKHGPLSLPVAYPYVWGVALEALKKRKPDIRLVNLETSITRSAAPWRDKEVHYRMHPANTRVLQAAGIDCVTLANNHTLDWQRAGLLETLGSLKREGISFIGAGRNLEEAVRPSVKTVRGKRVCIFGVGMNDCGIPEAWQAGPDTAGIFLLPDYSDRSFGKLQRVIERFTRPGDLVVVSMHMGGNWGFPVPQRQMDFTRSLIDTCGVDLVHGHSSHHVKGFEVYKGKLVLYGCGDLITDYEGISGHETYRPDLGLLYFATLSPNGHLAALEMVPTQMKRLQLTHPSASDSDWLRGVLKRESLPQGLSVVKGPGNTLRLEL